MVRAESARAFFQQPLRRSLRRREVAALVGALRLLQKRAELAVVGLLGGRLRRLGGRLRLREQRLGTRRQQRRGASERRSDYERVCSQVLDSAIRMLQGA